LTENLEKAFGELKRILRLSRKPKMAEYEETMKVTGLGILAVGFLGFLVLFASELIRGV